jgi:hypothetical protein
MRAPLILMAVSTVLGAQEAHEHEIGRVHFATSCASDVQSQFERGVALLALENVWARTPAGFVVDA